MSQKLILIVKEKFFAIDINKVQEIVMVKNFEDFKSANPFVRGSCKIRGRFFPLLDCRKLLGYPSLIEDRQELVKTLQQREQDHIDWLNALEDSIKNNTPFTKAKDPTKCAFGKWYYSYKAPSETIRRLLDLFEAPHNRIHSLAEKLLDLAKTNQQEAISILNNERANTLARMLKLFAELKSLLITDLRTLAVLLGDNFTSSVALEIDNVDAIRNFSRENFTFKPLDSDKKIFKGVWSNNEITIFELSVEEILSLSANLITPHQSAVV